ncbi:MAG: NADH-quinone oxidoreductase subunit L [Verrucomicrobia bacterium]|nr:NADH-quinone oxidoreductase subunit L [Verrucomicrobiota bacterium]
MAAWLILLAPLVSAVLIWLLLKSSRALSSYVSVAAVGLSFVCSCVVFAGGDFTVSFNWIDFGPRLTVPIGLTIDALSKTMLLVVTGVGLLVHVYSLGYMHEDRSSSRYFAGLSLFMFSMLGIVLANNFVMMFIFWELVGVSSYLLIGHWYEKASAADASKKAFLVNRIGDFGFMIGILMIWALLGTVTFSDLEPAVAKLVKDPVGNAAILSFLTVAVLFVFMGPVGKSAQMPLHVWLPDAMEGPTPVSALIHAATMVAAGVYLLVRVNFLLVAAPMAQNVIAWVGMITSLMAALMATQQNDIKRILAYSTLSQLGYMIGAVGFGAAQAAMFHLFTHAFFKASLFLGAGSVIHGMHHEQDIWRMGGLKNKMVPTFITFGIASLALMGLPYVTSGFYSKDAILLAAANKSWIFLGLGLATALLTAFYMTRLFVVTFLNKPMSDAAKHAHESPLVMTAPLMILSVPAVIFGFGGVAKWFNLDVPHGPDPLHVPMLAAAVFVWGTVMGWFVYRNRQSDPIRIGLFARKFYFDELYDVLVKLTQETLARLSAFVDKYLIDGLLVKGATTLAFSAGFVLRFFQSGNVQAYAIFFGLGVILLMLLAFR